MARSMPCDPGLFYGPAIWPLNQPIITSSPASDRRLTLAHQPLRVSWSKAISVHCFIQIIAPHIAWGIMLFTNECDVVSFNKRYELFMKGWYFIIIAPIYGLSVFVYPYSSSSFLSCTQLHFPSNVLKVVEHLLCRTICFQNQRGDFAWSDGRKINNRVMRTVRPDWNIPGASEYYFQYEWKVKFAFKNLLIDWKENAFLNGRRIITDQNMYHTLHKPGSYGITPLQIRSRYTQTPGHGIKWRILLFCPFQLLPVFGALPPCRGTHRLPHSVHRSHRHVRSITGTMVRRQGRGKPWPSLRSWWDEITPDLKHVFSNDWCDY